MNRESKEDIKILVVAILIVLTGILIGIGLHLIERRLPDTERSSSFVGYSQSCWQVGDTLHVVTAKGDTVKLDVSKLEGDK